MDCFLPMTTDIMSSFLPRIMEACIAVGMSGVDQDTSDYPAIHSACAIDEQLSIPEGAFRIDDGQECHSFPTLLCFSRAWEAPKPRGAVVEQCDARSSPNGRLPFG